MLPQLHIGGHWTIERHYSTKNSATALKISTNDNTTTLLLHCWRIDEKQEDWWSRFSVVKNGHQCKWIVYNRKEKFMLWRYIRIKAHKRARDRYAVKPGGIHVTPVRREPFWETMPECIAYTPPLPPLSQFLPLVRGIVQVVKEFTASPHGFSEIRF